ncbi:MAG: winged helix-turn-helix transcriptional regulator [Pseudomonadota bacterium]|nr:winged helix-turn-helix transcriptional regulator [Pseudomonadota bacterium]
MNGSGVDSTLAALADPTRRAVIDLLSKRPHRAGELAGMLALTPPALSRHLRVLKKSGLVRDEEPADDARVRLYRLQPEAFGPLHDWVGAISALWTGQLEAFKAHAERRGRR